MYVSTDPAEIATAISANQVVQADPEDAGPTLQVEDVRVGAGGELEVFAISLDGDAPAAWVRPARVWIMHGHRGVHEARLSARAAADRSLAGDGLALQWYARQQESEPWHIAACREHGRELRRYHFRPVGTRLVYVGQPPLEVEFCAVCLNPEILRDVERCTCETAPSRCPLHRRP